MRITDKDYFIVPADCLAIKLLGKALVRQIDGIEYRYIIAETECYMGIDDSACHASHKNPLAASPLWARGGTLYVRLIYGLHYMLNVVAGECGNPMGTLIRGAKGIKGPGNLAKKLTIDKSFNQEDLLTSNRIWIEESGLCPKFVTSPRIGIDYAKKADRERHWRFYCYDYL